MRWSRRVRSLATVGALAVGLGLTVGPADPAAVAAQRRAGDPAVATAPAAFMIHGAGYGHGIGMSQYGAHGMALRGYSASRILSFYYGGARAGSVRLPATIRVGLLQANAAAAVVVVRQQLVHRGRGRGRSGQADPGHPGGRRLGQPALSG